jgi:hypothetical protein
MTESDLLEHILDRLGRADSAEEIFGADEAAGWPTGALDLLIRRECCDAQNQPKHRVQRLRAILFRAG